MLVWLFGSNQRSCTRHHLPETEQVGHVPETVSGTVSRGVWSAVKGVDSDSSGCVFPRRVVGSWLPKVGSLFALVIVLIECGKLLAFLLVAEKCCCGMFFDSSLQWCARARIGALGEAY